MKLRINLDMKIPMGQQMVVEMVQILQDVTHLMVLVVW